MEEIWKPIKDYENLYEISNLGRVKSLRKLNGNNYHKEMIIGENVSRVGYRRVCLSRNAKKKMCSLHRLIALTFIPNPNNLPQVNHKNGIKLDVSIENLEWCTAQHNVRHSYETGLNSGQIGIKNGFHKLNDVEVQEIIALKGKLSQSKIARQYNVSQGLVGKIHRGILWTHIKRIDINEIEVNVCPHCGKKAIENNKYSKMSIALWHFDNCRFKIN